MNKKILIVCYTFPPNDGIGGRRWAKFAKYLHRKGIDVKVIAATHDTGRKSLWNDDIKELKKENRIKYLPSGFPKVLNSYPETIIDKINYRLSLVFQRLKVKGNHYDRSSSWKKKLVKQLKLAVRDGYTTIITTGAPFHYIYEVAKIKRRFQEIKLIVDLRDPWVWGGNYGIGSLDKKRLLQEENKQKYVVAGADYITVPVDKMKEVLTDLYPEYAEKIKLLKHAFDPDDIPADLHHIKRTKKVNSFVKLIYSGAVYSGLDEHFKELDKVFNNFSGQELSLKFYTHIESESKKYFSLPNINRLVQINKPVKPVELMQKIIDADFFLVMYPDVFKDHVSTKFPELLRLGIPVIYVGKKGDVSKFIKENKMGVCFEPGNAAEGLINILKGIVNVTVIGDNNIIDKHSYPEVTNKLMRWIG